MNVNEHDDRDPDVASWAKFHFYSENKNIRHPHTPPNRHLLWKKFHLYQKIWFFNAKVNEHDNREPDVVVGDGDGDENVNVIQ